MGLVYLPTWMAYFYGINVGKYTSPMDCLGCKVYWHTYAAYAYYVFFIYKTSQTQEVQRPNFAHW